MATTKQYAVTTQHDHPAVQQLAGCIEFLRSVCDGAVSRDYQGFSAFDAKLGHYLADQLAGHAGWSQRDLAYAVELAWRYREQLGSAGLSFPLAADLAEELGDLAPGEQVAVVPTPSTATVSLWRDGGWLCVAFSHYDHHKLAQLMSTVPMPDRWWDEANTRWLVNARHEGALAAVYGVAVDAAPGGQAPIPAATQAATRPAAKVVKGVGADEIRITDADHGRIRVRCPFELKDTLKAIVPFKHRAWDGADRTWLVSAQYREALESGLKVETLA